MTKIKVNKEEFDLFIKNYQNGKNLKISIVRFITPEVQEYNDFTLGDWPNCVVAQISCGKSYYGYFKTKEENDKYCIDEYYIKVK